MKVQLEKTFPLPAPADTAWSLLQNIERVAACMPGASITERIDAQHYKGTVAVRFGPANMSFRGELEIAALEPATKTLRLIGKGTDSTGSSGASMDLSARVEAIDAASCNLVGNSAVSVSGKAASFGGRMMGSVADQVLKQFAANFAAQVQAQLQGQSASASADAAGMQAATPTAPPPTPLNALALLWAIVRDWLRGLFAAKRV
jgi:carbon monoxide dehydrogenase subunit G